jgi:hypothetical protein
MGFRPVRESHSQFLIAKLQSGCTELLPARPLMTAAAGSKRGNGTAATWQRYAGHMNESLRSIPETRLQGAGLPVISVVVPTFNERDNVTRLYRKLEAARAGIAWEVVFVDDIPLTVPGA